MSFSQEEYTHWSPLSELHVSLGCEPPHDIPNDGCVTVTPFDQLNAFWLFGRPDVP